VKPGAVHRSPEENPQIISAKKQSEGYETNHFLKYFHMGSVKLNSTSWKRKELRKEGCI
jgi:hypothetical protein